MVAIASSSEATTAEALPTVAAATSGPPSSRWVTSSPVATRTISGPDRASEADSVMIV